MKKRWWILGFCFLVFVVYHRAFFSDYVLWDDDALIFNNMVSKKPFWDALETAFTQYYHGDFFPFTLMSYWADYNWLGGFNPSLQHIENLILQMLDVALLFLFLNKYTKNRWVVVICSLIFAIHPLQTETVMWISDRKSLLSAGLTFGSLYLYLRSQEETRMKWVWYTLSLLCFLIACLAKATTVLLPGLFLILDLAKYRKNWQKWGTRLVPMAAVAGVLSALRVKAYAVSVAIVNTTMWAPERLKTVPLQALNALGFYIQKFFWPTNLAAMYPNYFYTPQVLITCIWVSIFLMFVTYRIYKTKSWEMLFFAALFVLFLVPVLQIVPRINYVNDRYMYLPIVGLAGLLILLIPEDWLAAQIRRLNVKFQKKWEPALLALLVVPMGVVSYDRSRVWETNRALWQNTIDTFPQSAIAHNNLALDYQKNEEFDQAIKHYDLIMRFADDPSNKLLALNNVANIYSNPKFRGFNPEISINLILDGLKTVQARREGYEMRTNLGLLYIRTKKYKEAREVYSSLLKDFETEPDFRFNWLRDLVKQYYAAIPQ